jgi:Permuted papain-like amidase enzyme, YaeF/YiiX, C92 family
MGIFDPLRRSIGNLLIRYLTRPQKGFEPASTSDPQKLRNALRPGDVLLVEGSSRIAAVIKYLTTSTWSHSALYIGDALGEEHMLIEVEVDLGCVAVPLSKYEHAQTRICRPIGLDERGRKEVVDFMISKLGLAYDTKNIIDLARYLLPKPPVPVRFRRRLLALGSGDPTRAICSSLLAQAFERVSYPVLPRITRASATTGIQRRQRSEILHIRHYSLYAPRDFDLSPYFAIIKPTITAGFDYKALKWRRSPGEIVT